jgi:hypothetical protein
MDEDKELQKVLNKLRKLKNLYEGAKKINSEGEANNAASAIQKLLTQYNLSIEEIGEDKEETKINEEFVSGYTYKSIGGKWEHQLVTVICKYNFCKCYLWGDTYKTLLILGKKENLETVKWLRNLLSERFVSFSKQKFKEYQQTENFINHPISKDKYQRSYLIGCSMGLETKLKEEKEFEENKNSKITSLVLRNDSKIVEYVEQKFKTKDGRKSKYHIDEAFESGFHDGKNTELSSPLKSNSNNNNHKSLT